MAESSLQSETEIRAELLARGGPLVVQDIREAARLWSLVENEAQLMTLRTSDTDSEAVAHCRGLFKWSVRVGWQDVCGLEREKEALMEAVVLPLQASHTSGTSTTGARVLLSGCPVFVAQCFLVGDSNAVKQLFEFLSLQAPCLLIVDEIHKMEWDSIPVEQLYIEPLSLEDDLRAAAAVWSSIGNEAKLRTLRALNPPSNEFIERAVQLIKEAVDADNANHLDVALDKYTRGLHHFMAAVKYEKNPRVKQMIRDKACQYLQRAEQIKEYLDSTRAAQGLPTSGSSNGGGSPVQSRPAIADASQLGRGVSECSQHVDWEAICGHEREKEALLEALVLPFKFPQFFGNRVSNTRVLLFGMFMLDDSETVRRLFEFLSPRAPCLLVLEELDALYSESSESHWRRVKTELVVQMSARSAAEIAIVATSSRPWVLEPAIRRRFLKRVHLGLPDEPARVRIAARELQNVSGLALTEEQQRQIGQMTAGFSCSDIIVALRDAVMMPIRRLQKAEYFAELGR
eukprot:m51a1_g9274 putative vps4p (515) ;mRNA; r:98052-100880